MTRLTHGCVFFSRRFGAAMLVLAMSRVALTRFLNWQGWHVVETAGARWVEFRFFLGGVETVLPARLPLAPI